MKPEHKEVMKARQRNIALRVTYDGTRYSGFQRQSPPIKAVQNVLENALTEIFGDTIELAAAGRTDAGVHAYGQVVNFFTDGTIPLMRVARAVNGLLPPDITVIDAYEVDREFSARHSAVAKTYLYRIERVSERNPFSYNYVWQISRPLDIETMRAALAMLEGTHDFSSFRASGGADMSPVRTLYDIRLEELDDIVEVYIYGNGFLYHMVRNIISTVVAVGLGSISLERFREIFLACDRRLASPTAPARGLYLYSVEYSPGELSWDACTVLVGERK